MATSSPPPVPAHLAAMQSRIGGLQQRNRELLKQLTAMRHTEHCKRSYVTGVLYPEATQAIADEPHEEADADPRTLARAAIAAHAKEGSVSSATRAAQGVHRAQQLAILNPLVDQLRRMSDAYDAESGGATPASALAAASLLHEGARRGL
jgi:hypothetical protein